MTPLTHDVPLWKTAYTWGWVVFSLLSCYLLGRRWWQASQAKTDLGWLPLAAPWAVGNTAFTLCLGGIWGFHEFHRFMLPALPALLLGYQDLLPRRAASWFLLAGLSASPALYGLHRQASRLEQALPSPLGKHRCLFRALGAGERGSRFSLSLRGTPVSGWDCILRSAYSHRTSRSDRTSLLGSWQETELLGALVSAVSAVPWPDRSWSVAELMRSGDSLSSPVTRPQDD